MKMSEVRLSIDGSTMWTAARDPLPALSTIVGPETVRNQLAPICGADPSLVEWTSIDNGGCLGERWWKLGHSPLAKP